MARSSVAFTRKRYRKTTAYEQHGYFTTSQAREHGISSQLLSHYVRRNRFERVRRGLYRLPGFPRPEDDEMRIHTRPNDAVSGALAAVTS